MGLFKHSTSKFTVGSFTFIIIALIVLSFTISPLSQVLPDSEIQKTTLSPTYFSQSWNSSWSLDLNTDIETNLVLADIVGDSALEIIVGCKNGSVFLFDNAGNVVSGWPVQGANFLSSTPTVINLDATGPPEILVGGSDGKIYAWNSSGSLITGFPVQLDAPIEGTIAAGDVLDDSLPEIVVGTESGKVYVIHSNGTTALGDIDGDSDVEVVVGSDDKLYALNPSGTSLFGFPVTLGGDLRSSPALGDLNADGDLEIVVASTNGYVYAIQYTSFALPGWPKSTSDFLTASVALADVNLDGYLEVIVGDDGGDMYIWNYQGTALSGWPKGLPGGIVRSAIVGNIMGDEEPEIVVGTDANETHVWYQNGTIAESWPKTLGESMIPTPAIGDIFGNNTVGLVTISSNGNLSMWYANLPLIEDTLQWPQFQFNSAHSGLQQKMVEGSLLLDKETYQPGDIIYASGEFQFTNGTGIPDANAEFNVFFPNGTLWTTVEKNTDSVGEVEHQFQLEPIYPEGTYTVELKTNKTGIGIIWKQQTFSMLGPDQAHIVVRASTNNSEPLVGTHVNVTFTVYNVGKFNATSTQVNITLSSKLDTTDPLEHSLGEIGNKSLTTFSITVTPNALSVASINATSTWYNKTGSTHYGPSLFEYSILTLPSLKVDFTLLPTRWIYGIEYDVNITVENLEPTDVQIDIHLVGLRQNFEYIRSNETAGASSLTEYNFTSFATETGTINASVMVYFENSFAQGNWSNTFVARVPNTTLTIVDIPDRWIYNRDYLFNGSIENHEVVNTTFTLSLTGGGITYTVNDFLVQTSEKRNFTWTVAASTIGATENFTLRAYYLSAEANHTSHISEVVRTPLTNLTLVDIPTKWIYSIDYIANFSITNFENVTVDVAVDISGYGSTSTEIITLEPWTTNPYNRTIATTLSGELNLTFSILYEGELATQNWTLVNSSRTPDLGLQILEFESEWVMRGIYNVTIMIGNNESVRITTDVILEGLPSTLFQLGVPINPLSTTNLTFFCSAEFLGTTNLTIYLQFEGETATALWRTFLVRGPNFDIDIISPPETLYLRETVDVFVNITNYELVPINLSVYIDLFSTSYVTPAIQQVIVPALSYQNLTYSIQPHGVPETRMLRTNASFYGVLDKSTNYRLSSKVIGKHQRALVFWLMELILAQLKEK
ncbi:MAG: FG-GAP-like repeat-containing protein [Candidatus Ranarchaeia archaeon]|jgi:hypothetical protein